MSSLPKNCEIFITQDGSPTLLWKRDDGYAEKMHHSGGALGESFFIYHDALTEVIRRHWPVRILSIGLGLGYNELIAVGELQKSGIQDWRIWSFETEKFLRDGFRQWLLGDASEGELSAIYNGVLSGVAQKLGQAPQDLKQAAGSALGDGRLELRGGFPGDAGAIDSCTCIFYDAYSKKMAPELWGEDELQLSLKARIAPQCILATYACTGSLKRALKALAFQLLPRAGFLGKRERTLAIRDRRLE